MTMQGKRSRTVHSSIDMWLETILNLNRNQKICFVGMLLFLPKEVEPA
jgi:hypothetical protein